MGTLSSCLKKIGLSQHETAILRGSADDNMKDGDAAHVAAVRAVSDFIEQLEKDRDGVVAQAASQGVQAHAAPFRLADLGNLTAALRKDDTPVVTPAQSPTMEVNQSNDGVINNGNPVPSGSVSGTRSESDRKDFAAGNNDRQSLDDGLAENGQATARESGVSGRADQTGSGGKGSVQPSGSEASGTARDLRDVRAGSESAAPNGVESDFEIDADTLGKGGLSQKFKDNVEAIRIVKAVDAEGRSATAEERRKISKFVGWGALKGVFDPNNKQWAKQHAELKALLTDEEWKAARKSILNAHYTSPIAVKAMYEALDQLGVKGGRILEPSVGVGNFFGLMPKEMRANSDLHGVELDSLPSKIVAALYPKANIAKATGFQDYAVPSEFFDVVIGNPPFGNEPIVDMDRSPYSGFSIHNYFLAKSIDKLRPGGIMQIVVSHSFLDALDDRARKWIWDRAALIGAVRLPNTAFKENAGTEVVTDILVFQKRDQNGLPNDIADWRGTVEQQNINPKTGETVTHRVSEFFANNPRFVLGKPSAAGSQYSANEYTIEPTGNLEDQLTSWVISLPENIYTPIERAKKKKTADMEIPEGVKAGSYFVARNGEIMRRGDDVLGELTAEVWEPPNKTAVARMKGMITLRDLLRTQMRLERSPDATEAEIEANRASLNAAYDDFLKNHGHINNQANRRVFNDDTESQLVQALEFDYDPGVSDKVAEKEEIDPRAPSATKADIFDRRIAFPPSDSMKVETAKDALLASLNFRGRIDSRYIEEVSGRPAAEIFDELGDVVFEDPQAGFVSADEYLSGDVKTKLDEAKIAAQSDVKYARNVAALEKVIPEDKKPSEITVSIGAQFVSTEVYGEFVNHITGAGAAMAYIKATGQWLIEYVGTPDASLNVGKFGTEDAPARKLFELSLQGRGIVIKQIIRNGDGSTTTVVMEKETEAARAKQAAIRNEWNAWIWKDQDRAMQIAAIYNERMNRIVERKFDGSHMTFPGMNPAIKLLDHQKNGVWRGLQTYRVLYDHVVGAGKTFQLVTLAMEMRRLGIARKPLFVVPNHLVQQWRSEFTRLYPGSNILAAEPDDFSKNNRGRLFSRIITGDWDAVIVGHSSLKKIGLPVETEKAIIQEQIDEISNAIEDMKRSRGDKHIVRDMERIRSNLEAKLRDKLAAIGKRDKVVTFDELGIDAMMVDEMHEFKNLAYNSTMDRNPGMGNPNGSAKAFDMFVKVRWLFDTFGEKTPFITATGTPVSNSLVEMFNMQRYMQYPTLKQEGLHVFDAWAKQFGNVENVYEVAPSGTGYRQSTRFAKFSNLPALMNFYNSFADTVTLDDLKAQEEAKGKRFPVPKLVSGGPVNIVAERSPQVANFMGVPRAEVDESGAVQFALNVGEKLTPTIEQDANGKWVATIQVEFADGRTEGRKLDGLFETREDAELKIVERAIAPRVSVDPESILGQFANLRQLTRETKGRINALSLTNLANKAGLDFRLINPAAPDFPGSKINLAVNEMMRVYQQWDADKGTQLVFCDMSIPLSAKKSYAAKERRLYVRDENGQVEMKRGTLHAAEGVEFIPFFVVQRGQKESKRFDVYDATTGVMVYGGFATRREAKDEAAILLATTQNRQAWMEARDRFEEISKDEVSEYNDENDIDTTELDIFSQEDIQGASGAGDFSVYDDIKAKLIARGVPEHEIAFIHDFNTPTAKAKLFSAVNRGYIRFLIGSTPKMGAGTNVQTRIVGLHHIDAPWRPSDLEQREGRAIRRGNMLYERDPDGFEVFIGRYATRQTYDTRRWQILEHKANGIEQLRNFDGSTNEIEDIDGEAANAADMKAAASGDPLILEETKLRNEVTRLERLQDAHADEKINLGYRVQRALEFAYESGPARVAALRKMMEAVHGHPAGTKDDFKATVSGEAFTDIEEFSKQLAFRFAVMQSGSSAPFSVSFRGQRFVFSAPWGSTIFAKTDTGDELGNWGAKDNFSPSGFVTRMQNFIERLPAMEAQTLADIAKALESAEAMKTQAALPFSGAKDLEGTRQRHANIRRALMAKGPAVPDEQKPLVEQGIERQKKVLIEAGLGNAVKELFASKKIESESTPAAFSKNAGYVVPEGARLTDDAIIEAILPILNRFGRTKIPVRILESLNEATLHGITVDDDITASGFVAKGQIFLVRDGLESADAVVRTMFHELLHYGLRRFMTRPQYIQTMRDLYDASLIVKNVADSWISSSEGESLRTKGYGDDYILARGVDEALAAIAEEMNHPVVERVFIKKRADEMSVIEHIRTWLARLARKMGLESVADMLDVRPIESVRYANQPHIDTTHPYLKGYILSIFDRLEAGEAAVKGGMLPYSDAAFSTSNTGEIIGRISRMAEKDTVAGTQAPTSAGDGSTGSVVTLYSGSREQLSSIHGGGAYGGIFASASKDAALSHGDVLHELILKESEIMSQHDMEQLSDDELLKAAHWVSPDDAGRLWELVVDDNFPDQEDDLRILKAEDSAEAAIESQRLRGVIARRSGFKAVEMSDEHGLSYLVLPGSKISPVKSNEPSASAGSDAMFAKDAMRTNVSPSDIRNALISRFGERGIKALEKAGMLKIIRLKDAPQAILESAIEQGASALYTQDGVAYLFSDRMTIEDAPGKLLHEIGEHYGLERMLGNDGWGRMKQRIIAMAKAKGSIAHGAWQGVKANYGEFAGLSDAQLAGNDRFLHEVLAAIGENKAGLQTSLWRELLAKAKEWLASKGLLVDWINEGDIANLVSGSLKKVMRQAEAGLVAPETMESIATDYFRQIVDAMKEANQLIEDCA